VNPLRERQELLTRRMFFGRTACGIGAGALASLMQDSARAASREHQGHVGVLGGQTHRQARAKRVIYLFMADGPAQLDLFDYKPKMFDWFDKDLPDSVRNGQRITTMTSGQARFPIAPTKFKFARHGKSGALVSELLPHAAMVDDLCIVKSMHTNAINHDPAITFMTTGSELPGRPSLGAWSSYGLGSENRDLPSFVVLVSMGSAGRDAQALFSRLWGSGFLPTQHQGVALRSQGDPVLYLSNPNGVDSKTRRRMLDGLAALNEKQYAEVGDPETVTRIAQYEMAYRMQRSVPELVDLSNEPESVLALYGPDVNRPGSFAYNALLARRLAERDVRFVQLFHRNWDQHENVANDLPKQCGDVDQACAGLIKDLKQRGMLDDTLVVWATEFGRTIYCQGPLSRENYGRDHHPRCFTIWMAGGGVKGGVVHGETDDFGYNIVEKPVHVHDLNATILHLMGIQHERLTYRFQGRDFRLTDVEGIVQNELLA
jgi:Protein of unknown function (DUF1501)